MLGALLLGRVSALSPVARAKNDGEGENKNFREWRAHA
jgi:hypothetical protein